MAKNKPDVFMPLYIGDYLADTAHLTTDQHGAYLLLLMAYWRNGGPLRDDDAEFAAITRQSASNWKKMRPTLQRFFSVVDRVWISARCEKELAEASRRKQEQKARTEKARAAKQAVARKYVTEVVTGSVTGVVTSAVTGSTSPSPSPSPSNYQVRKEQEDAPQAVPPDGDPDIPAILDRRPKAVRGTRLPDDWEPDRALFDFAAERGMTEAEAAESLGRFKNYWLAKTGAQATKLRWDLTAKNWISTDAERSIARRSKPENGHDTFRRGLARYVENAERYGAAGGLDD